LLKFIHAIRNRDHVEHAGIYRPAAKEIAAQESTFRSTLPSSYLQQNATPRYLPDARAARKKRKLEHCTSCRTKTMFRLVSTKLDAFVNVSKQILENQKLKNRKIFRSTISLSLLSSFNREAKHIETHVQNRISCQARFFNIVNDPDLSDGSMDRFKNLRPPPRPRVDHAGGNNRPNGGCAVNRGEGCYGKVVGNEATSTMTHNDNDKLPCVHVSAHVDRTASRRGLTAEIDMLRRANCRDRVSNKSFEILRNCE